MEAAEKDVTLTETVTQQTNIHSMQFSREKAVADPTVDRGRFKPIENRPSRPGRSFTSSQIYEPVNEQPHIVQHQNQVFRSSGPLQNNNNLQTPLEHLPCATNSPVNRIVRNNTIELERKEFQRQVMFQLNLINAKLSDHTDTLQLLLNQRTQGVDNTNPNAMEDILGVFPIENDESLNKLEEYLKTNKIFLCWYVMCAKELSRIGGDTAKELTKRIMYRTMTNIMGQLYSWDGAKGKRPFKNLLFCQLVLKAVRTNERTRTSYEDETVKTIKQWLVRAKDRLNNQNKKLENQDLTNLGTGTNITTSIEHSIIHLE
ncbi:hypothetical protein FQR65_LT11742 [Abscondita terminalis]|nr:hypothetical protein FQR65_LT11742 [Abscondita terminalis]